MKGLALLATLCLATGSALADGVVIDIVYDPYVQPLERELEWRMLDQKDSESSDRQRHLIGVGRSLGDRFAAEAYLIASDEGGGLSVSAYEAELKWQLTEQGEFAIDWGLLFEVERNVDDNTWELASALLGSRDLGRWTLTGNAALEYESGQGIDDEFETELHGQARFRYRPSFEPAIEVHVGENTIAAGPAVSGLLRLPGARKLRWSGGYFRGLDDASYEHSWRLTFEYEFVGR